MVGFYSPLIYSFSLSAALLSKNWPVKATKNLFSWIQYKSALVVWFLKTLVSYEFANRRNNWLNHIDWLVLASAEHIVYIYSILLKAKKYWSYVTYILVKKTDWFSITENHSKEGLESDIKKFNEKYNLQLANNKKYIGFRLRRAGPAEQSCFQVY